MRDVQATIDRLAQFQIDSVNIVARAHYLPLFSRLGPYDVELLHRAAQRPPRRLFEYWGHEASLIDVRLQPALRWRMAAAAEQARERLIHAEITPEQRAARESMILAAAEEKAAGSAKYKDVNVAWDRQVLDVLASGDLARADAWRNDWMVAEGGSGAQEMRTWLAAWSASASASCIQAMSRE